jgi:hypothetical protein
LALFHPLSQCPTPDLNMPAFWIHGLYHLGTFSH